jgi:thiosulfate dehydrogenase (quinone) large subunit
VRSGQAPRLPGAAAPVAESPTGNRRSREAASAAAAASRTASRLALAILPLRLFVGGTFLYAGIDKLIDPTFLRTTGAGSVGLQLQDFVHISPLAPLIQVFAEPAPILMGVLIAVAEIAIGLGTLLGVAQRAMALGGLALSALFWLTASWATHPFYYGADLPYGFAWLTLALAGEIGWSILPALTGDLTPAPDADASRRRFLQTSTQIGALGIVATIVGGISWLGIGLLRQAGIVGDLTAGLPGKIGGTPSTGPTVSPGPGASPGPTIAGGSVSAAPTARQPATTVPTPGGAVVGQLKDLQAQKALGVNDPITGDPVWVLDVSGTVVAYDAICTHAGCTVEFDPSSGLLVCPCHGATFDPAHNAQVLGGPTRTPLPAVKVSVDQRTGSIYLTS